MKKSIKAISVLLAIVIMLQSSITAFATVKTKSSFSPNTYTHQSKQDNKLIIDGIDVSQHNGTINFAKVKNSGIEYVFVRVGYTGYTKSTFSTNYDANYKTYISDAINAGLKVGVYWYSQALNTREAKQEAKLLVNAIKSYNISMPVVMDYEFAGTSSGRLDSAKLSQDKMTANALAFLKYVDDAGYDACLYASKNFLEITLDYKQIQKDYTTWVAHYTTKTDYKGSYDYWQYTSVGTVPGISGNVDMNFWYYSGYEQLDSQVYTGDYICPEPEVIDAGAMLIKDIDYTLTYKNNINPGKATIVAKGINEHAGFSRSYTFNIVPPQVTGLTLVSKAQTSLEYAWDASQWATSYTIYVKNLTKGNSFSVSSTTPSVIISGLTAGNSYSVSVSACYTAKDIDYLGEFSNVNIAATMGASVKNLKLVKATTASIKLGWDNDGVCEKYYVYKYSDTKKKYVKIAETASKSYTVKNLKSGTKYKFIVRAVTNGRLGPASTKLKVATNPKKVSLTSAKSPARQKITLKWKKQTGSGYQIQWSTTKDFSKDYKDIFVSGSSKTSKTIQTAKSKRGYYVRVRAYKLVGNTRYYGNWSKTLSVKVK